MGHSGCVLGPNAAAPIVDLNLAGYRYASQVRVWAWTWPCLAEILLGTDLQRAVRIPSFAIDQFSASVRLTEFLTAVSAGDVEVDVLHDPRVVGVGPIGLDEAASGPPYWGLGRRRGSRASGRHRW